MRFSERRATHKALKSMTSLLCLVCTVTFCYIYIYIVKSVFASWIILGSMLSSVLAFYEHLTSHIVPGPKSISYFVAIFLLQTALLIPPSILSRWQLCSQFLPLIYACLLHAWIKTGCIDVISMNVALWSLVLLACRDPRRKFRRVHKAREKPGPGDNSAKISGDNLNHIWEEPYPSQLSQRVPWIFTLLVSLRLTNWKIGEAAHDRTQPPNRMNRTAFLRYALVHILAGYLILDVTSFYIQTDTYFYHSGMSVDGPLPRTTSSVPAALALLRQLPPRFLRASVLGGQIYAMVTLMFLIPTLPAIALNALELLSDEWSPHTWPIFFGPFSAIAERGIRGLWGSWWHQMNRHLVSTPGRFLANAWGIPRSSLLGYALLTTSAFFFSGVMHMGLVPPEPLHTKASAMEMRLRIAAFFWAQIPAIGVEILVSKILRRLAPKFSTSPLAKFLTMIWVAAWSAIILPILTVPFRELGYWRVYPVPVSIMQGLSGNGWLTWPVFVE